MAASKAGSRREVLPFPSSPRDKQNAIKKHKEAKKRGLPIPHFKKKDGSVHYLDNKGNGRLMFNDLATKLANEAGRRANKLNAKPKLEHYVEAYGQKLGTQLFQAEQAKLKKIYKNTPSKTHDVDHANSLADGGVHHSSNLRMQNSGKNRSEGQRQLPAPARVGLMQASTPQEQVRMAGPAMTPKQRQRFLQSFDVGNGMVRPSSPQTQASYNSDLSPINGNTGHSAVGSIAARTNQYSDAPQIALGFGLAN
jgi:hypothetical protein